MDMLPVTDRHGRHRRHVKHVMVTGLGWAVVVQPLTTTLLVLVHSLVQPL